MPPPPPPPPPGGGFSSGGYYSSNAGSTSSTAARRRLGLGSQNPNSGASSGQDDWFASSAAAPPPAPAAPSGPSSGFYSANTGGSGYGASYPYGSGVAGGAVRSAAGAGTGGGGYYGGSGGGASSGAMSGAMGSGAMGSAAPVAGPSASTAFGSNPNSGSSGQMNLGGSGSFDSGGGMSGSMGGPIGGSSAPNSGAAPTPNVFDPNAAAAKKAVESSAMAPAYEEDYENEPPLLEELGVNFPHIYSKSKAVIFPFGSHAKSLESGLIEQDADLAGPLAFALGLGGELLLAGKMQFGYVYGFGLSGCLAMTLLLNLLNPNGAVSMWTVVSILGYALLPVNLLAAINALVRIHRLGRWGMIFSVLTIAWSTTASARLFERGCNMREQRFLVAYPAALLYSAFVMITIF